MRLIACLALVAISAATVNAEEASVSKDTLQALGLGSMKVTSHQEALSVRGRSGNAAAMGLSLVTGLIVDPNTKSFIFGSDTNAAMSSAENAGLQVLTQATSSQASALALQLDVNSVNGLFQGFLIGGAGGNAAAASQ